jgi:hypothetical protein
VFKYEVIHEEGEGGEEEGVRVRSKIQHVIIDCYISKDWPM